jgi:hypothetical protein
MKPAALIALMAASMMFGQGIRRPEALPAEIGPATITVTGISGSTATLTAGDLYQMPQQAVETIDHGTAVTFEGVLLSDVLAKVRTPTGEAFNKTVASYYLVAEGQDGYKAVFSWAEIDSTFAPQGYVVTKPNGKSYDGPFAYRQVFVVMKRDGKPLSNKDGPFELIVPGEKRYSRWVRQVKALTIRLAD